MMVDNSTNKGKLSLTKNEILDLFARSSHDIAIAHDLDGNILYINDRGLKITGYSQEEVTRSNFKINDILPTRPESDLSQNLNSRQINILTNSQKFETILLGKEGSKIPIELSSTPILREGEIKGVFLVAHDISERDKKNRESIYNKNKFENLSREISTGVAIVIDGKNYWVNKAFADIFGYEKSEIIGKEVDFVIVEEEAPKLIERIEKTIKENNIPINCEMLGKRKDGSKIYLDISAKSVDFEGKTAIQIVLRDITEKKKSESELKKSEEKIRSIFKTAPIGIVFARNRIIEFCNDKFCEMLEYTREELIGQCTRIHYPNDKEFERVGKIIYEQSEKEGLGTIETEFKTKSGKILNILLNLAPIDGKDTSKGVIATAMDITERKRERKKLEESEERYKATFEHTGTAMAIIEEDTTISLINSEFERLSGYSKAEIEGKMSWVSLVHPDDIELMKKYHSERRLSKEVPRQYEFRGLNRMGEVKDIFLTISKIPGTNQSIASLIDITETKKIDKISKIISDINELVARENNPQEVLSTLCVKMAEIYEAVFTSINESGKLIPVQSEGIKLDTIARGVLRCPSVKKALKGETTRMNVTDELCKHCTKDTHRFVLSIPLIHDEILGVITFHSNTDFTEFEIKLLEKLSRNIAFALSAYEIEEEKRKAFEQLASNLTQFEHSADRLRNPLAAIISALELIDDLGTEKAIKMIKEHALRIEKELDEMRKDEIKTFFLLEDF